MQDSRTRFTETADAYDRFRPGYPEALRAWVASTAGLAPGARVVDLGCGTGISARCFAAGGFDVVGVDPNPAMLDRARARAGGPRYVVGESTATGLPAASAELVVAAQAFHWFDLDPTLAELARVLVPGGWVSACWNLRAGSALDDAWDALITRYSHEYRALQAQTGIMARVAAHPRVHGLISTSFPSAQPLDREAFFGRAYSSSYVVHGIDDHAGFDRELGELFERMAVDGVATMTYRTEAHAWQLRA